MFESNLISSATRGLLGAWLFFAASLLAQETTFPLKILPSEAKQMTDPETGASLLFLTMNPADDESLYYEQRSWLADSSLILFNSSRTEGGLMGYVTKTGELLRLAPPEGGYGGPTGANLKNSFYALRRNKVVEVFVNLEYGAKGVAKAVARERVIASLPDEFMPPNTALTENANGTWLAVGTGGRGAANADKDGCVVIINVRTGETKAVHRVQGEDFGGHVVFSRTNPNLVSFVEAGAWLSVVDVRTGRRIFQHKQVAGEFATHHCWWLGDTITFTGGFHPQPTEDADVKVMDIHTGEVRIVGKGSWWPGATPAELARQNWWHACGSEQGRWLVADNWHGDIGIFHARTTRTYILTKGHRTYGSGRHPEVGWDRKGEQVIFASHKFGNVDVCVATIPRAWQDAWQQQVSAP